MVDNFLSECSVSFAEFVRSRVFDARAAPEQLFPYLLAPRLLKNSGMNGNDLSMSCQRLNLTKNMKAKLGILMLIGILACCLAGFAQTNTPAGDTATKDS